MRVLSWVFYALAAAAVLFWLWFYLYIQGLACAFGSVSGSCRTRWPWQLGGEDLVLLVVFPLAVVLVLAGLGWLAGRFRRRA